MTPPVIPSSKLAKPDLTPTQPKVLFEEDKTEKSPVICRVKPKSDKDTYKMYVLFSFIFAISFHEAEKY